MSENEEKPKKRVRFLSSDTRLLLECVKSHAEVLENKETNKISPEMKHKVN